MGILYLVRHGETTWNQDGRLTGWSDVPLTPLGELQAKALREPLSAEGAFDSVWSSDLRRASQTARLAGFEASLDPRLRELDFGDLEGERWRQLAPRHTEGLKAYEGFEAPGGESMAQMRARVMGFVEGLSPGRHLIFTHGGVVRLLTQQVGYTKFVSNCATVAIDWSARALLFVR